jgi:heme-degrading monooxygenase HmoA
MFARHVMVTVKKDKLDEALKIYRDRVVPAGKAQKGYRGLYLLTDRDRGKIISISLWDSAEDAAANEASGYFQTQTVQFSEVLKAPLVKEGFEVSLMLSKAK